VVKVRRLCLDEFRILRDGGLPEFIEGLYKIVTAVSMIPERFSILRIVAAGQKNLLSIVYLFVNII
jgi:hypothetical protein